MAVLNSTDIFFHAFEPKVQNRFIMSIAGIPAYMVHDVAAPSFTDAEVKVDHINSYFKIRGKRTWENSDMTLYDPISPSGIQAVMDWARLGYESVSGRAGYQDFYKQDIVLNMLGPVGDYVSEWVYKGAWVQKVNAGSLKWSDDGNPTELQITICYDYAVLNY